MRPQLTIAIPTYNRAEKLRQCLDRVICFSSGKDVEIIVSDNASTDNTSEVVRDIQSEHPEILYYCNDQNLGFDGNFLNCFERAHGFYIWLLSDDDIILPGALESVLAGCLKKPVCMHLNTSGILCEVPLKVAHSRYKSEGLMEYHDKNAFIKDVGIFCTFLSSLIFNLDLVRKIENKKSFFGTNILQSYVYFETMRENGLYIIDTFNCVAARGNKSVWYDVLATWVKSYSELLLVTAPSCGFNYDLMDKLLKRDLENTIYEFVVNLRQTCSNEAYWDRNCIWKYINRYPELVGKYRKAVDCPVCQLKLLGFIYRVKRKIASIYGKFRKKL